MRNLQQKLQLSLHAFMTIVAMVIIIDFAWSGRIINDEIVKLQKQLQQHNNASGNYHYSYKVITNEHQFWIDEDFAKLVEDQEKIEYSVSPIFEEVNWYSSLSSQNKSTYSLRILSGLVIPLLTIIAIVVCYRSRFNIGMLVFLLQVLLIANLIYLMM